MAHLVLVHNTPGQPQHKTPVGKWRGASVTPAAASAHVRAGGLVGIIPSSIGAVVIDVDIAKDDLDTAAARVAQAVCAERTDAYMICSSSKGRHVWVALDAQDAAETVGNTKWRMSDPLVRGDIRGSEGYIIAWQGHESVLAWRSNATPMEGALEAIDGLCSSRRHERTRNDALYSAVYTGASQSHERARGVADGLPLCEVTATIASALTKRSNKRVASASGLDSLLANVWHNTRGNIDMVGDEPLSGIAEQALKCEAVDSKLVKASEWEMRLGAWLHAHRVDPFEQWLSELPEWDGTPRIDTLLCDYFRAENTPLTRWVSRYIFACAIERTLADDVFPQHVPILIGPQGCGKSSFLRHLLHDPMLHSDRLNGRMDTKSADEAIGPAVVVEIPEMVGVFESSKAWITSPYMRVRRAYGKRSDQIKLKCVIVGTTNEEAIVPNDATGARRWVPVTLTKYWHAVEKDCEQWRKQWWAEALAGERGHSVMPVEMYGAQTSAASVNRARDDVLERVVDNLDPSMMVASGTEKQGLTWYTTAEVARSADPTLRPSSKDRYAYVRSVSKALRHSSVWVRSERKLKVNGGRWWCWRRVFE